MGLRLRAWPANPGALRVIAPWLGSQLHGELRAGDLGGLIAWPPHARVRDRHRVPYRALALRLVAAEPSLGAKVSVKVDLRRGVRHRAQATRPRAGRGVLALRGAHGDRPDGAAGRAAGATRAGQDSVRGTTSVGLFGSTLLGRLWGMSSSFGALDLLRSFRHSAILLPLAVLSVTQVLIGQHTGAQPQKEQSAFGIDDAVPVVRPVTLSRAALNALSRDERVASCLEDETLSVKALPANWFVASEIHLDGPNETDLVVLPGGRLRGTPAGEVSPNACLVGANTAQMWVLRKTQDGFKLVLSQIALGMNVLATRTNGLRDIEVSAVVGGGYADSIDYKFDGQSYRIAGRTSELIGAELPHTLTAFKAGKTLIQSPSETSDAVRAQARAWLWLQWKERNPSYLKLETHDQPGGETSSYFIAPGENGNWQVTIQARRTVRDDDATASQHQITEKELLVATEVQRVEAATDATHDPRVLSEYKTLPTSKYRLQFLDYAKRTVATL